MGVSSWINAEAEKVLKRTEGRDTILFETGYGPSGLPHIGTFAEVARTCFVIEAVKRLDPDKKIRLLCFSDDMDGLRKLPGNVPNNEIMRPFLGFPLTSVPDPYEKFKSFGEHNNAMLRDFLDSFGFSYEFASSTEYYAEGKFNDGLRKVMDNYDKIREMFIRTIAKERRETWSPFFVRCGKCKKINTARITGYDKAAYTVDYICDQDTETYSSCGHTGTSTIFDGNAKVGWKVDWAMRWAVLGVDFEMHGEDLTESVRLSREIAKVLGGNPPITFKYELFQDEKGQKISKTKGNGMSMDQWVELSPLGALVLFLAGNPNKPRRMGLPILPALIDEFLGGLDKMQDDNPEEPQWFLKRFTKAVLPKVVPKISYTLIQNVCESFGENDPEKVFQYALKYDPALAGDEEFYRDLCVKVVQYCQAVSGEQEEVNPDPAYMQYLKQIKTYVDGQEQLPDGDEVQRFLFSIARDADLNKREWFLFLYNIFLAKNSGPKMGPYFAMIGRDKLKEKLDQLLVAA